MFLFPCPLFLLTSHFTLFSVDIFPLNGAHCLSLRRECRQMERIRVPLTSELSTYEDRNRKERLLPRVSPPLDSYFFSLSSVDSICFSFFRFFPLNTVVSNGWELGKEIRGLYSLPPWSESEGKSKATSRSPGQRAGITTPLNTHSHTHVHANTPLLSSLQV